ncbi:MAG: DNA topoisomerase, partial [Eubacterium sp.]|nr:DNA topoisomerase [Eubacterium sp.]
IIEILRGSTSVKQARACLTEGITEGIKFKSKASEKQAATLLFTPTQTDAILTMQLSKLIGLEIVKLHEEYDKLVADIKEYNEILGDKSKLYSVIKKRLRKYKKILGCERRTQIDDIESKAYVEEVKEEDLYVFIDRFGYVKSMDSSSYQRLDEVALAEYRHILCVKNTDRLCVFTKEGMLYYIKTEKIPAGKQKDRGTLVNALTGMSNTDEAICFVSFEQLYDSMVFFATKKGYVKFVSGVEFESDRLKISSTKMGDGDELAAVQIMSAGDYLAENSQVVMITKDHMTISYGKEEVSEYKRASRGVTGMKLGEGDEVEFARVIGEETKEIEYNNKNVRVKRIPILRRAGKGKKIKL